MVRIDVDGWAEKTADEAAVSKSSHRKIVFASSFGAAIEHYDFFCYAFIAPIVFDLFFFPKMDHTSGLIAVYATFAVGFVARPLGGMIFGHYGDRIGRKQVLIITLVLMGATSFLIGCLPGYGVIGIWAPILLVVLRFFQGFAFGGEYMNAVALTMENAPSARRGFFASLINASGPLGIIVASGSIAVLADGFGVPMFTAWLWRVPFLFSLLLVAIGTYVRFQMDESVLFTAAKERKKVSKVPLEIVFRSWKKATVQACLMNMVHSAFQYMSTVFVLGFAVKRLGMSPAGVASGTTIGNIIEIFAVPVIAHFSDRFGRRPFLIIGILCAAAWYPVFFAIIQEKNVLYIIIGLAVSIGLIHAMMFAPEAAFTAELFPTEIRVSGSSLGKQLGIIFGGGCAPLIATSLMGDSTNFAAVIWYFEVIAALALIAIVLAPESSKRSL